MDLSANPFWIKVVDMLQQNWAIIDVKEDGARIVFFSDLSVIFDEVEAASMHSAESALRRNGFQLYDGVPGIRGIVGKPKPPFKYGAHPNGRIYSSGRFWR